MWVSDNYKAKYKNIIIPFVITTSENQISEIKEQIDFCCNNGKPSLAAFTIQALGFNKSKISLLTIDMISKKHKNKISCFGSN